MSRAYTGGYHTSKAGVSIVGRLAIDENEVYRVCKTVEAIDARKAREEKAQNAWRKVTLAKMPWDE